jgi:hypothetical protein
MGERVKIQTCPKMSLKFTSDDNGYSAEISENNNGVIQEWVSDTNQSLTFVNKSTKCLSKLEFSINPYSKKIKSRKKWRKRKWEGIPYENTYSNLLEIELDPFPENPEINERVPEFELFKCEDNYGPNGKIEAYKLMIYKSNGKRSCVTEIKISPERKYDVSKRYYRTINVLSILLILAPSEFDETKKTLLRNEHMGIRVVIERPDGIYSKKEYDERKIYKILRRRNLFEMGYNHYDSDKMIPRSVGQIGASTFEFSS